MSVRAPRYPSTGDSIHADPLVTITPASRTFSVYASETIRMSGIVSSDKSGLLFYDHDRELFLHRPVFTDLLATSAQTAIQVSVINEFARVENWKELRQFFSKLDKVLVLDQFRQYLADQNSEAGREIFLARAIDFCRREELKLGISELSGEDGLRRMEMALAGIERMKSGFFVDAVPDLLQDRPDPALCRVIEQRRAQRWLNNAIREGSLPSEISQKLSGMAPDDARQAIVEKYMSTVEDWEGSPLGKLSGAERSRVDLEELLTEACTSYCPSPLGWTPRLRFAFYPPDEFRNEELDVQIEVIAMIEKRIMREIGVQVKMLYIPDNNCLVLERVGGETGGGQIPCTYENSQQRDNAVLNLRNGDLMQLASAVCSARDQVAPRVILAVIDEARVAVEALRAEMSMGTTFSPDEDFEMQEHFSDEESLVPEY